MGLINAIGITATELTLEDQIGWHFSGNCYPPIPKIMIPVAIEAINACWEEDYSRMITLPDGIQFRDSSKSISASQAVESLRLEAWCLE